MSAYLADSKEFRHVSTFGGPAYDSTKTNLAWNARGPCVILGLFNHLWHQLDDR